jgi:UDP-glucose 4-epimerase
MSRADRKAEALRLFFEKASGKPIPFEIVARRAGDLSEYYAEPTLAKQLLGWEAKLGIDKMCEDTWRWQVNNPNGYRPKD